MEWTREPPGQDGFYWLFDHSLDLPRVVQLQNRWLHYPGSDQSEEINYVFLERRPQVWWHGPLLVPQPLPGSLEALKTDSGHLIHLEGC